VSDLKDPRVLFAAERTLLAWNRSSLALIAFGFLIERSALLLELAAPQRNPALHPGYALWLGLGFILLGVAAALHSCREYRVVLRSLTAAEFPTGYRATWGMGLNLAVALLGALLAAALWLNAALERAPGVVG